MYTDIDSFVRQRGGARAIRSILIANNGIAAVKCIRSVREFAYETFGDERAIKFVAMATPEDMRINAEYIKMADQYIAVPGGANNHNYANVELIADIAQRTAVDAVWAGWGHASENPKLPNLLKKYGILFIGPQGRAMQALGDKISSTIIAQNADVPCLPWSGKDVLISSLKPHEISIEHPASAQLTHDDIQRFLLDIPKNIYRRATVSTEEEGLKMAEEIGYPIMIKASEGGGGKGIRKVEHKDDFIQNFSRVQGEVPGSPIFLMKLAGRSRHLEVQLIADEHGNVVSLYGRDCSVQRRHQKIIEESPAIIANGYFVKSTCASESLIPSLSTTNYSNKENHHNPNDDDNDDDDSLSADSPVFLEMEKAAVRLAKIVGYVNAGTVEYLFCDGKFYFLELNPRLQVEHPCTEMISGINLPAAQVQIAMGIPLYNIHDVATLFNHDDSTTLIAESYTSTAKHSLPACDPAVLDLTRRRPPLGHVIACRITAENPDEGFKPTSGNVLELSFKSNRNAWGYFSVNAHGGLHEFADSQFGHLFAFGETREKARKTMVMTLKDTNIRGDFRTTTEYLIKLLETQDFKNNDIDTTWLDDLLLKQERQKNSLQQQQQADSKMATEVPTAIAADSAIGTKQGLVCAATLLAYLRFTDDESVILKALEKGQIPNQKSLFLNTKTVDLIYEWEKYAIQVSLVGKNAVFGSEKYVLILNDSIAKITLQRLNDHGLLILFQDRSYTVYMKEESDKYRFTINAKTMLFYKENDPTKIRASTSGKLIKYLVEDHQKVSKGQAFAEVEVMKMIMPLLSTENGTIIHSLNAGSILSEGTLIAELILDDPSQVRIAMLSSRTFEQVSSSTTASSTFFNSSGAGAAFSLTTPLSLTTPPGNTIGSSTTNAPINRHPQKNSAVVSEYTDAIHQVLDGYGLNEPLFSNELNHTLEGLFSALSDPRVPLDEMQEIMSSLAGRIPAKVESDIHCLLEQYSHTLNSMFCSFPSQNLSHAIHDYAQKTFGATHIAEKGVFFTAMGPVLDVILKYQYGLRGCLKIICANAIKHYLDVESLFNQSVDDEKTFEEILLNLRNGVTNTELFRIVKSRQNLENKNKLVLHMLDVIKESFIHSLYDLKNIGNQNQSAMDNNPTASLGDLFTKLSLLTRKENAKVAIKAKQILIQSSLPSFKKRYLEMEMFIQNAIEKVGEISQDELKSLIAQCGTNFDVLTHFFQHPNEFIQAAALEVYVRRTYNAYSIENIRHDSLILDISPVAPSSPEGLLAAFKSGSTPIAEPASAVPELFTSHILEWRFSLLDDSSSAAASKHLSQNQNLSQQGQRRTKSRTNSASNISLLPTSLNTLTQQQRAAKSSSTTASSTASSSSEAVQQTAGLKNFPQTPRPLNGAFLNDSSPPDAPNHIRSDVLASQSRKKTSDGPAHVSVDIDTNVPCVAADPCKRQASPSLSSALANFIGQDTDAAAAAAAGSANIIRSALPTMKRLSIPNLHHITQPNSHLAANGNGNLASTNEISTSSYVYDRTATSFPFNQMGIAAYSGLDLNLLSRVASNVPLIPGSSRAHGSSLLDTAANQHHYHHQAAMNFTSKSRASDFATEEKSRMGILAHAGSLKIAKLLMPTLLEHFPLIDNSGDYHKSFNLPSELLGESMNVLMFAIHNEPNLSDDVLTEHLGQFVSHYSTPLCLHDIRRVTFLVIQNEAFPKFFTYRRILDYKEDLILRHLEPALAYQLELYRLANYHVEYIPTHNQDIHLYFCQASPRGNPAANVRASDTKDRRFFIRKIIRHADLISRQSSVDYFLNEGERVMLECMNELEVVLENGKYAHTDCNVLFLNFTPRVQLDVRQMSGAVRQLICRNAGRLIKNRITLADIRLQAELMVDSPAVPPTLSPASSSASMNLLVAPATALSSGLGKTGSEESDETNEETVLDTTTNHSSSGNKRTTTTAASGTTTTSSSSDAYTYLRLVIETDTGYSVRFNCYIEKYDPVVGTLIYESLPEFYPPGEVGPLEGQPIAQAYATRTPLEMKRFSAQQHKTTYVYDYPALFKQAIESMWKTTCKQLPKASVSTDSLKTTPTAMMNMKMIAHLKNTTPFFSCEELILCQSSLPSDLSITTTSEISEKLSFKSNAEAAKHQIVCGMVAFLFTAQTAECPAGRRFIVISNDITYQIGSFGPNEDKLFFLASRFCRTYKLPRIYISANSGARIGLAQEAMDAFQVAWKDPQSNEKGFEYLYLEEKDYLRLTENPSGKAVNATRIVTSDQQIRYRIDDIIGLTDGLNVENLHYSGLIAGETSAAYDDIFTITLVSARSVGIGAYLVRLGQRAIQVDGSSIILTGATALNKVLGSTIYTSNQQLGGTQIMAPNGISHLVVKNDYQGVLFMMRWMSYIADTQVSMEKMPCLPPLLMDYAKTNKVLISSVFAPTSLYQHLHSAKEGISFEAYSQDLKVPLTIFEGSDLPSTPRQVIETLFDKQSFIANLSAWAPSVIVGRARLGGLPVGVVATEVGIVETTQPADPANPETQQQIIRQAGQVWYPDSASKTAQFIEDANREKLPLFILANWRGFSGGMRDMFNEILKFGSRIVDALRTYNQPIFVVIPPHAELRGGAWVVLDPAINPSKIDMFVDQTARGGVLEPEGTVEIKFRKDNVDKVIRRMLKTEAANGGANNGADESSSVVIDAGTRSAYRQVALHFADLHDTPGRMLAKGCITGVVDWRTSRHTFYWRLRRRLFECEAETRLFAAAAASDAMKNKQACVAVLQDLFVKMNPGCSGNDYASNDRLVADWFIQHEATIRSHLDKRVEKATMDSLLAAYNTMLSPEMRALFLKRVQEDAAVKQTPPADAGAN